MRTKGYVRRVIYELRNGNYEVGSPNYKKSKFNSQESKVNSQPSNPVTLDLRDECSGTFGGDDQDKDDAE